ncbi:MAG: 1-acyl-sn-glycerol-3-phosphate acyltransferase [Clostridia bacterium]|nr:1-acyl-sn-glycerol-3-phosphate acyltransferase [Clostridia bacterium]
MSEQNKSIVIDENAEWKKSVGWDKLTPDERVELMEREGIFDIDAGDDPPTYELLPDQIDYEHKKLSSKFKSWVANWAAQIGINGFIKKGMFSIKEVKGIENWQKLTTGAIITCNHFSPTDSFIMQKISKRIKKKKLFRIIREGNYTNPPVLKFFMRNCDVLPLSSNMQTMRKLLRAVDNILKRGDDILIYPEESLWPNYRKPKPLKDGAFKFATKNNVPVLPIFITMEDSEFYNKKTKTAQPILAHTVHILEPIYPNAELSRAENVEYMKNKNYDMWVKVYEDFYGKKLEYTTIKKDK